MVFGLGVLRLAPDAFWRMTPVELAAAARGLRGSTPARPLKARELADLMRRFPDEEIRDG